MWVAPGGTNELIATKDYSGRLLDAWIWLSTGPRVESPQRHSVNQHRYSFSISKRIDTFAEAPSIAETLQYFVSDNVTACSTAFASILLPRTR